MAGLRGLIYLSDEVEGKVHPSDRHLRLFLELLEVEVAEVFEVVVAGINSLHVQLFQLELLQSSQLLVAEVEHLFFLFFLSFFGFFFDFCPDERLDFFIANHYYLKCHTKTKWTQ